MGLLKDAHALPHVRKVWTVALAGTILMPLLDPVRAIQIFA
jgi:hypothetical protein